MQRVRVLTQNRIAVGLGEPSSWAAGGTIDVTHFEAGSLSSRKGLVQPRPQREETLSLQVTHLHSKRPMMVSGVTVSDVDFQPGRESIGDSELQRQCSCPPAGRDTTRAVQPLAGLLFHWRHLPPRSSSPGRWRLGGETQPSAASELPRVHPGAPDPKGCLAGQSHIPTQDFPGI
jgi:hypothetical protein